MFKIFKWLLIYCLFFGGIGFAVSSIFSQFPVLDSGAKGYVMALKERRLNKAYGYMSEDFRKKVTYNDFIQGLKDSSLYYATKWEKKDTYFNDDKTKGVAIGFITIKQGEKMKRIPVEIRFIHAPEQGVGSSKSWYVQSITEIEGGMP